MEETEVVDAARSLCELGPSLFLATLQTHGHLLQVADWVRDARLDMLRLPWYG